MSVAIMTNTPYDPELRYHNASGDVSAEMLAPPSSNDPGLVGVYVRRGASGSNNLVIGQNISYQNGSSVVTGPIRRIDDIPSQSSLVYLIPYSGAAFSTPLSGGSVSLSAEAAGGSVTPATSAAGKVSEAASNIMAKVTPALKTYWPFIAIALVAAGGFIIWRRKKGKT
jgi:nitrate reductase NapE component